MKEARELIKGLKITVVEIVELQSIKGIRREFMPVVRQMNITSNGKIELEALERALLL